MPEAGSPTSNDPFTHLVEIDAETEHILEERGVLSYLSNRPCSPILRLPLEILAQIFLQSLPEANEDGFRPQISLDTAPLLLEQVCHQWKAVAWSIPGLWSSISLTLHQHKLDLDATLIGSWLSRSGKSPLSLSLRCDPGFDGWNNNPPGVILDSVTPHSERWQEIKFVLPASSFNSLGVVKNRLLSLEKLSIARALPERAYHPYFEQPLDAFSSAPLLQVVRLTPAFNPLPALPWGQLTRLCAARICPHDCLGILRQSSNIRECHFWHLLDPIVDLPHPNFQLVQLSSLEVTGRPTPVGTVLDCMTLPNLREITLGSHRAPWPYSHFISLMARSSCPLTRPSIHEALITDHDLIHCLQHTPFLAYLDVKILDNPSNRYTGITDKVLHRLTYSGVGIGQCLTPRLKDIIFSIPLSFTGITLAEMLLSRIRPGDAEETVDDGRQVVWLRSFQLDSSSNYEFGTDVISKLRLAKKQGVDIRIRNCGLLLF